MYLSPRSRPDQVLFLFLIFVADDDDVSFRLQKLLYQKCANMMMMK